MEVTVKIEPDCPEPQVVVIAPEVTPEINELVKRLGEVHVPRCGEPLSQRLVGYQEEKFTLLKPKEVLRIYGEQQKVLAQTEQGVYQLRIRLYEAEQQLKDVGFVRISNSEIVNFERVRHLDMSFNGTIELSLDTGARCFVSRRYVARIKRYLGIGKRGED